MTARHPSSSSSSDAFRVADRLPTSGEGRMALALMAAMRYYHGMYTAFFGYTDGFPLVDDHGYQG